MLQAATRIVAATISGKPGNLRMAVTLTPNVQGNRRAAPILAKVQAMCPRVRLTVRLGLAS